MSRPGLPIIHLRCVALRRDRFHLPFPYEPAGKICEHYPGVGQFNTSFNFNQTLLQSTGLFKRFVNLKINSEDSSTLEIGNLRQPK